MQTGDHFACSLPVPFDTQQCVYDIPTFLAIAFNFNSCPFRSLTINMPYFSFPASSTEVRASTGTTSRSVENKSRLVTSLVWSSVQVTPSLNSTLQLGHCSVQVHSFYINLKCEIDSLDSPLYRRIFLLWNFSKELTQVYGL